MTLAGKEKRKTCDDKQLSSGQIFLSTLMILLHKLINVLTLWCLSLVLEHLYPSTSELLSSHRLLHLPAETEFTWVKVQNIQTPEL